MVLDTDLFKSFCASRDLNYLAGGSPLMKEEIKEALKGVSAADTRINISIYWILRSYVDTAVLRNVHIENLCEYLSNLNYDLYTQCHLFYTLYNNINLKGLLPSLYNLGESHLEHLFILVDTLYLFKTFEKRPVRIKFKVTNDTSVGQFDKNPGGFVASCERTTCTYIITINRHILTSPFKKYSSQSTNGVICRNPLECLLHTFLHEIVHLVILTHCEEHHTGESYLERGHTAMFKKISLSLFGHTRYTNAFGFEVK